MPAEGSYGTCRSRPLLGEGRHGLVGHVNHVGEGEPYAVWVKDSLEVALDQVRRHSGQAVQRQKRLYDQRAARHLFAIGNWVMRHYPSGKKCKLDSIWAGPYLVVATLGWTVGIQRHPDEPVIFIHCQDVKKIPQPSGVQSWITIPGLRRFQC